MQLNMLAKTVPKKESNTVDPTMLGNDTIFARVPLYHNIITAREYQMRDEIQIADFLILKNKVIYRQYGNRSYPSCHDEYSYKFFSCQIFDVPDGIFDTPVIHELFEIIPFTSSDFSEIVYYRAERYKKYPPPNLESSDKTLYEFLFEINKKQKVVLSHKTCKRALADYIDRHANIMEGYNKLNPMRSIYHYVDLIRKYTLLKTDYTTTVKENKLYQNKIKTLEEEIKQLKDVHTILKTDCITIVEENELYKNQIKSLEEEIKQLKDVRAIETATIEKLTKNYNELNIKYYIAFNEDGDFTIEFFETVHKKRIQLENANIKLQQKCDFLVAYNKELRERTKILDESNF